MLNEISFFIIVMFKFVEVKLINAVMIWRQPLIFWNLSQNILQYVELAFVCIPLVVLHLSIM